MVVKLSQVVVNVQQVLDDTVVSPDYLGHASRAYYDTLQNTGSREQAAKAAIAAGAEDDRSKNTFKPGDEVLCPNYFGGNVLTVKSIIPIPQAEQRLSLHSQWVIVTDKKGTEFPSKSGYYFQPAR